MKIIILSAFLVFSVYVRADNVAICTQTTKIVSYTKYSDCKKKKELICDNTLIYGHYFPAGSQVVYTCNFKNPSVPTSFLSVKSPNPFRFEKSHMTSGSKIEFMGKDAFSITFGDRQKFKGHVYGRNVTASFKGGMSKPFLISGASPFEFDGNFYKRINLHNNGNFWRVELAEDAQLNGYTFSKVGEIEYSPSGNLLSGILASPFKFKSWKLTGKTHWHENGIPSSSNLDGEHNYLNAKLSGEIRFDKAGEIEMGTISEPVSRFIEKPTCMTVRWKKGDRVGFGKRGEELWGKWYPQDLYPKPESCR